MAQTTEPNDHLKAVPGPCFPKELFAKIFSTACERTDDEYDHMFQFSLAAVSKQWQDIVLNFPCVWAPLCVALNRPVSMAGVQACLNRSKSMPLDIVLHYPETSEGHELEAGRVATLIQALKPHISRWRSLKLYLRSEAALKAALDHLPLRGSAEKLEELVLHMSSKEQHETIPSFDLKMPILRHLQISGGAAVRLIGPDVLWLEKMKRLAALSVTGASNIDMGAVFAFIKNLSFQDTLELLEIDCESLGPQIPDGEYTFPQLKKIRLKHCFDPLSSALKNINLSAPNLEILEVVLDSTKYNSEEHFLLAWQPFGSNAHGSARFPLLHTFQVVGPFEPSRHLACLEHCESLIVSGIRDIKRLLDQLGRSNNDAPSGDLTVRGSIRHPGETLTLVKGWFCTHLRSLEIHHCDGLDPTQLQRTIDARQIAFGTGPLIAISSLIVYDEKELPIANKDWFEANLGRFQWIQKPAPTDNRIELTY